ncbi:oligogalacturonate-specific porin KdgM family protein [Deefgea piscis]|uniref:oligogalacturonate-specific porin KdgM family protein n=1 Tax=Deefgea piscis TaxID=2739061 RepID=UPI001C809586|nr:oligogalacturonate-specific porin KdgM family protein [Deefgea piscis]QZA82138.1 oligogalacturonate-specific porin KdgM family protein [Deefgea piscis]
MKIKYLVALACSAIAIQAHATSIDFRGGYKTGSEKYESRILLSHEMANGFGGGVEYSMSNTSLPGEGIDQMNWTDTEFELYYKHKLNAAVTLQPGFLVQTVKNKGEAYKAYIRANWEFAPTWRFDSRLRYDFKGWSEKDLNGKFEHDEVVRADFWLQKSFNEKTSGYYNFRVDHKLNDFEYVNNSSNYYEHNIGLGYKLTPSVRVYTEVGYLGETANKQHDAEWRVRFGSTYSF